MKQWEVAREMRELIKERFDALGIETGGDPVDGVVVEEDGLGCDESLLTGEWPGVRDDYTPLRALPPAPAEPVGRRATAEVLGGRRVYALVMSAIVPDLAGVELVGDSAEAVLVGGCDETVEPNQVFSYMNLARAFSEIQAGADLFCLHRNPWWQTSRGPMLDSGAFVAALEFATGVEATLVGKPSASAFARSA